MLFLLDKYEVGGHSNQTVTLLRSFTSKFSKNYTQTGNIHQSIYVNIDTLVSVPEQHVVERQYDNAT